MINSRRDFIKSTGLIGLGFLGLNQLAVEAAALGFVNYNDAGGKYGPLEYRQGEILSLPKGFTGKIISRRGDKMSDGLLSPGAHDGMGVFKLRGNKIILIRNHELSPGAITSGPFGKSNELLYKVDKSNIYDYGNGDAMCYGGTTTLVYNEKRQKIELEYLSLIGTVRNCAGGITPWNSWLTCEETSFLKGGEKGLLEKDHGYNFEVFATEKIGLTAPVPIKPMGRFVHEAVAVHPREGIVYQTEDTSDSLFYRYVPVKPGDLHKGGKLQCLVVDEWTSADTRNWANLNTDKFPQKTAFNVHWEDLDNVEAPDNDLRLRGYKKGAARFSRGEGIWYGKDELFFACTDGGMNRTGQIFKYIPSKYEGAEREKESPATLELYIEPNDINIFQNCDNLTIAPWGDVIICEDKSDPRIVGITPEGKTYVIAKNIGYRQSEFAGPVFSPSGKTLFVNIQSPGLTLAITGPW
ncbi:MAG: alkaline phosphatase PhoX [Daejeonella sp.]